MGRSNRGPAGGRRRRGARALADAPSDLVERLFRQESGRAVATVARALGDIDLAEEAVQDAFAVAIERWPATGVPDNPAAWITTTARNRAIDRLRRQRRYADKLAVLEGEARRATAEGEPVTPPHPADAYPDDRLALMFACCHPALAAEARVALTLRTLGGLSTREIARALVQPEATVAQRLVRAKRKIRDAAIPIDVPPPGALDERTAAVLAVIYLVFNEAYLATATDSLTRPDLAAEAIRLARMVVELLPGEPEAIGLLALLLLHDARRAARVDDRGEMVLLAEQDRARWDRTEIEEGLALLRRALSAGRPGPYQIQAAIAAVHAEASSADATDWDEIVALYERLAEISPSPVVELNRAAAVSIASGPEAGLRLLDELGRDGRLDRYHLFHSARGDVLRRLDRTAEAVEAYRRALELASNPVDRKFLRRRLGEVFAAGT
jgi:RNA polymerase sigma-70 factor (ECF subfamily)